MAKKKRKLEDVDEKQDPPKKPRYDEVEEAVDGRRMNERKKRRGEEEEVEPSYKGGKLRKKTKKKKKKTKKTKKTKTKFERERQFAKEQEEMTAEILNESAEDSKMTDEKKPHTKRKHAKEDGQDTFRDVELVEAVEMILDKTKKKMKKMKKTKRQFAKEQEEADISNQSVENTETPDVKKISGKEGHMEGNEQEAFRNVESDEVSLKKMQRKKKKKKNREKERVEEAVARELVNEDQEQSDSEVEVPESKKEQRRKEKEREKNISDYLRSDLRKIPLLLLNPFHFQAEFPGVYKENGEEVQLSYIDRVSSNVFKATIKNGKEKKEGRIVKFVRGRYGREVHEYCAEKGFAPALYSCEYLSDKGVWMVVMHMDDEFMPLIDVFMKSKNKKFYEMVKENLKEAVKFIHEGGYVHGDIRLPNVLFNEAGKIHIVDFDWAGKEGLLYPNTLNDEIAWPEGAGLYKPILADHDDFLLGELLALLSY